ncbi:hypothetical protein MTO96_007311 [Rhipicephalus appendiculatus]
MRPPRAGATITGSSACHRTVSEPCTDRRTGGRPEESRWMSCTGTKKTAHQRQFEQLAPLVLSRDVTSMTSPRCGDWSARRFRLPFRPNRWRQEAHFPGGNVSPRSRAFSVLRSPSPRPLGCALGAPNAREVRSAGDSFPGG